MITDCGLGEVPEHLKNYPRIRASKFGELMTSAWHYYFFTHLEPKEETKAMLNGRMLHLFCLEREKFDAKYTTEPDMAKYLDRKLLVTNEEIADRLKELKLPAKGKKENLIASFLMGAPEEAKHRIWELIIKNEVDITKEMLSHTEMKRLNYVGKSLDQHPKLKTIFQNKGENEIAGWFFVAEFGIVVTMTADRIFRDNKENFHAMDIKSCPSARIDNFANKMVNEWLYVQAAVYFDGFSAIFKKLYDKPMKSFLFAPVEAAAPYSWACYRLNEAGIDLGQRVYKKGLARLAECMAKNHWPAYSERVEDLAPPTYYFEKVDRMIEGDFYV